VHALSSAQLDESHSTEVEVKFYRREVSKVNGRRAKVVDKRRGVRVFKEPQVTVSRTGSKWVILHHHVRSFSLPWDSTIFCFVQEWVQYYFIKVFIILQFSSSPACQNLFLWAVVWTMNMQIGQ
jgi:hypothetical protein